MVYHLTPKHNRAPYSLKHSFGLIFHKIETVFFSFLCVICLITSKVSPDFSRDVAEVFIDISLPIAQFAAFPFNTTINLITNFGELANAKRENKNLKEELVKLKGFYINSLNIHQENKELRHMLNFVSAKTVRYKTARVIGRSSQIFNQKIFIDAGRNRGIKEGELVIGKYGAIGRITEVYENKSHLFLLTDATSRIPIITSKARMKAILAGNGSGLMEILYLPKNHQIQVGELVFTSTDGDVLPPGFLLGVVKKVSRESASVSMVEDVMNADLVSVLE
ncbi:MAG: rod shape-determining protein MreC [Alphaproteobacteria bacterium]|nr:rod shape-determining protein MreC [Alphaproteobacteria bacterium]